MNRTLQRIADRPIRPRPFIARSALGLSSCCRMAAAPPIPPELLDATKTRTIIDAFLPTTRFDRHDPSNITQHEGAYWACYTRNVGDHADISVYAASSTDGGFDWGLEMYTEAGHVEWVTFNPQSQLLKLGAVGTSEPMAYLRSVRNSSVGGQ